MQYDEKTLIICTAILFTIWDNYNCCILIERFQPLSPQQSNRYISKTKTLGAVQRIINLFVEYLPFLYFE